MTQVEIESGTLVGVLHPDTGVRSFRGVPFAAPPVGDLRWREPQPARPWAGLRQADRFGPRAMQQPVFGDMDFRSDGMSEDCLYLNVWAPADSGDARLPVLVYFYGGGFVAGDGSEPRYDGERLASRGIVTLTVNYRLGAFGFMAHPELSAESPQGASGNYAFLDQLAALGWVRRNIAAFGGDPGRVTIAGESAGSFSVSAQMASPMARDLIAGAIGSSGSLLGDFAPIALAEAEQVGLAFAQSLGAGSLAALRAIPAERILAAPESADPGHFLPALDGHFLPRSPQAIFAAGEQAHIPLMAGWNSEESGYAGLLGDVAPTPASLARAVRALYGERADEVLRRYRAADDDEAAQAATDL
ncbi:carboxylesterase family protein, partial [Oscillochloris sp. ZM17-4]|uniref:carboxylesterase/lipase family protein n=1 Tax=Oscillochloris sp. ZM17-4 TaxID=2866714 RepID=UPI001C729D3B